MKLRAAILLIAMAGLILPAKAQENVWPSLAPGEVKTVDDISKISDLVLQAAGLTAAPQRKIQFTFFKAPHGHNFLIINPCCGESGKGSSLFEWRDGAVKVIGLVMGDPRLGFTAQGQADDIKIAANAASLRAGVYRAECEDGIWTYYYHFDEADRLTLLSVIDTSCAHLGVRELYHARDVDVGHWWMK